MVVDFVSLLLGFLVSVGFFSIVLVVEALKAPSRARKH